MSATSLSVVSVNGDSRPVEVQRSRYQSKCPACRKLIVIGAPVAPYAVGKRTRWKHEDCENIPAQPVGHGGELTADAAAQIAKLQARVEALEEREPAKHVIEIRRPGGKSVQLSGTVHPVFSRVLALAQARKHIFLPGPAGCGKSHLAHQVAQALGLPFGAISCSAGMSESQLLGRMVPHGDHGQFEFLSTQFLDCYESGGVFLFDEIDAADSNVLLVVNSALANGHLSVPSRHGQPVAKRHADFVCLAAANTFGRGADRQYVGRNQLDESTLDRFRIGTVPMDYDEQLETQLCPDAELLARLRKYRANVQTSRLERVVSTRFIRDAADMVTNWGWSHEQVDEALFQGWRSDEIAKARG